MLGNGERNEEAGNVARVRRLRREAGVSERVLWSWLRSGRLGFRFRRQHPVGPYVLDFYCAEAMLCVEVDGELHGERIEADARRDGYLAERRIQTYRVRSLDLFEHAPAQTDHVARIVALCEERTGRIAFPEGFG